MKALRALLWTAVAALGVRDIVVVGHYRCGGVRAAMNDETATIADEWRAPICAPRQRRLALLNGCPNATVRWDKLSELNLLQQVRTASQTPTVREAWARRQDLAIHGWIYSIEDGHLRDLKITMSSATDSTEIFDSALEQSVGRP